MRKLNRGWETGLMALAGLALLGIGGPAVEKTREGNRAYSAGQYSEAQTRYVEARAGVPEKSENSCRLHLNLGDALYQQKKYGEARKEFEQAAGSESIEVQSQAAYNIGNTYFKEALQTQDQDQGLELLKQAVAGYRKALEMNPNDADAKYNLEVVRRHLDVKQQQPKPQPQACPNPKPGGQDQKKDQEQKSESAQREPQPQPGNTAEPKQAAAQPQAEPGSTTEPKPKPAPGEAKKPEELSKEEAARLLDALQAQEEEAQKERYQAIMGSRGGGKDW